MTEKELRQKVVDTAVSYLGCKEANGSHRKIIDLYNSHKPLARGYAVKYTDAWCSTFASAVAIACGLTDIIPTECGCERHIDLFKKLGSWVENDAYVPSPGDYIFYDWQDGSNYATTDNTGSADHVGIVVSCDGKTIPLDRIGAGSVWTGASVLGRKIALIHDVQAVNLGQRQGHAGALHPLEHQRLRRLLHKAGRILGKAGQALIVHEPDAIRQRCLFLSEHVKTSYADLTQKMR